MPDGYHPPLEEYLETVHDLEEDGIPVIQARLAERLGHSAPSVSETVHRLREDGYVSINGRTISLTGKGRRQAESVVRKHRLAERLLTDIIGLEWHKSHSEATRWEHVISDEVEARLVTILDNPATCPHGNPIPGSGVVIPTHSRLAGAATGSKVRLERVTEQVEFNSTWLAYLGEHHFVPGVTATVVEITARHMTLQLPDEKITLSTELTALLHVTVL